MPPVDVQTEPITVGPFDVGTWDRDAPTRYTKVTLKRHATTGKTAGFTIAVQYGDDKSRLVEAVADALGVPPELTALIIAKVTGIKALQGTLDLRVTASEFQTPCVHGRQTLGYDLSIDLTIDGTIKGPTGVEVHAVGVYLPVLVATAAKRESYPCPHALATGDASPPVSEAHVPQSRDDMADEQPVAVAAPRSRAAGVLLADN